MEIKLTFPTGETVRFDIEDAGRHLSFEAPMKLPTNGAVNVPSAKSNPPETREHIDKAELKREASIIGVSLPQYRILRALNKFGGAGASAKQLTQTNCGYATRYMRPGYDGSLTELGYVDEEIQDVNGRDVLVFSITGKGRSALTSVAEENEHEYEDTVEDDEDSEEYEDDE